MNRKIRWITETAVMLALLICLQWVGSMIPEPMTKQLITGTLVNCVLAVTVRYVGLSGGVAVAVISPVMAWLLNIAPQPLVVPAIMVGNVAYVLVLHFIAGKSHNIIWQILALFAAATVKFLLLFGIVGGLICKVFAQNLLESGTLKAPAIAMLTSQFSWPQLVTALAGGAVALGITPALRKALHK